MKSTPFVLALALFMLFGLSFAAAPPTVDAQGAGLDRDDIQRIAQSVVLIYVLDNSGEPFSTGSGTIVSNDGIIYTNQHVTDDGADFAIFLLGDDLGELPELRYFASLRRDFTEIDFAILQIDRDAQGRPIDPNSLNLPFITPSNADVSIGDQVTIFGYPTIAEGYMLVTTGTIAGVQNGTISGQRIPVWYQTAAEIAPGNSGGLAVNDDGELIGLPTAVVSEDRTGGRIGGILPYTAVRAILEGGGGPGGDPGTAPGAPPSDAFRLSIANESAATICAVYVSPSTSSTWGDNLLGSGQSIAPGQTFEGDFAANTYDIRMDDCAGTELADTRGVDVFAPVALSFSGEPVLVEQGRGDSPGSPDGGGDFASGTNGVIVECPGGQTFENGVEIVVVDVQPGTRLAATALGVNGFDPVLAVQVGDGAIDCNDDSDTAAIYAADLPTTGAVTTSGLNSQLLVTQDTGGIANVHFIIGGYNSQPGEFLFMIEGLTSEPADGSGDRFSVRLTQGMVDSGTDLGVYMIATDNVLDPYLYLADPDNQSIAFVLDNGEEVYCDDAGNDALCWDTGFDLTDSFVYTVLQPNLPGGNLDSMLTIPLGGLTLPPNDPQYFSFMMTSYQGSSEGGYVPVFHVGTR